MYETKFHSCLPFIVCLSSVCIFSLQYTQYITSYAYKDYSCFSSYKKDIWRPVSYIIVMQNSLKFLIFIRNNPNSITNCYISKKICSSIYVLMIIFPFNEKMKMIKIDFVTLFGPDFGLKMRRSKFMNAF